MSILYLLAFVIVPFILRLFFPEFTPQGYFRLGRFVDLAQLDLIIWLLWLNWRYQRKRWLYLMDKKNV